jgi:hypothetical protein
MSPRLKLSPTKKAFQHAEWRLLVGGVAVLPALLVVGCRTPISAIPVGFERTSNQVEGSERVRPPSGRAGMNLLQHYGLQELWRRDRGAALQALHQIALQDERPEVILALGQLNYAWAEELKHARSSWAEAQRHYLQAAIYAWTYLFPPRPDAVPTPIDRGYETALALYSRALALSVAASAEPGAPLDLDKLSLAPFGVPQDVPLHTEHLAYPHETVQAYFPAQAFLVDGLAVRNQISGLGAPLIARLRDRPGGMVRAFSASLVLRVDGDLHAFQAGTARLSLELRSPGVGAPMAVDERMVPVAQDLTAPMAYALSDERVWELALRQFFREQGDIPTGIYPETPHVPGRIPVVLIHGTVSSPVVWAAAINTLRADAEIRDNFEFWLFIYRSGYPINYTAVELRAALRQKLQELREQGDGDNLSQLVVVGHSQGGLLAKLTAVDPGTVLWDAVFEQPFEPDQFDPKVRSLLDRGFFFEPVPEVKRVVFMATPHRGSDVTNWWLVSLLRRLLQAPQDVLHATAAIASSASFRDSLRRRSESGLPTSVDDMDPANPWLLALADLPLAEGVTAHSVIALKGSERPPDGSDGVVPYRSAHVPYVASEHIVRSRHSVQRHPAAIEELRRILRQHLVDVQSAGAAAAVEHE